MNVFLISPGRTATTTLAEALKNLSGFTSEHESRCSYLGDERINFPENHIECDNRLTWFLPRLTKKYGANSILIKVVRDKTAIAKSYNKRWSRIKIMKAYSQGILMRGLAENNLDVCVDYVNNVYEQIDYFSKDWKHVITLDLNSPDEGLNELFKLLNVDGSKAVEYFHNNQLNKNESSFKAKYADFKFNIKMALYDLFLKS